MRAIHFDFEKNIFELINCLMPVPAEDEVLVKVAACGLNPVDAKISLWKSLLPNLQSPWIPGLDISGEIVAVGKNVVCWRPGDQVLYHGDMFQPFGGFAQYALAKAQILLAHPRLPAVMAASLPCAGWTAWRALVDKLQIKPASALLILGAGGGVGSYATQIARYLKVDQIIAVCSANKHSYIRKLGATHVIDYHHADVIETVMEITQGIGITHLLDAVGNSHHIANVCLHPEGALLDLVSIIDSHHYENAFMRSLSFHQFSLGSGLRSGHTLLKKHLSAGKAFTELVAAGEILPAEIKPIYLEEIPEALSILRAGHVQGKIVADISGLR